MHLHRALYWEHAGAACTRVFHKERVVSSREEASGDRGQGLRVLVRGRRHPAFPFQVLVRSFIHLHRAWLCVLT